MMKSTFMSTILSANLILLMAVILKVGPTDGKNQKYSRTNLMKRWLINGSNDGWYWSFEGEKK